jgi:hypothetical protein
MGNDELQVLVERLDRVEAAVTALVSQGVVKNWYTTHEVARILNKVEFTVREWCRHGRVHCQKKTSGRGKYQAWVISHEELLRIQREGLLPINTVSTRIT